MTHYLQRMDKTPKTNSLFLVLDFLLKIQKTGRTCHFYQHNELSINGLEMW